MNAECQKGGAVDFSHRVYRRLLRAYPRTHREEYGAAMAQLFRDQCRDAWNWRRGWGLALLWLRVLPDLLRTALWERLTSRAESKQTFKKMVMGLRAHPPLLGIFASVFLVVFLVAFTVSIIYTMLLPDTYASRARIRVGLLATKGPLTAAPASPAIAATGALPPAKSSIYDPADIQTIFAVLNSEVILDRVIDALNLNETWGTKYGAGGKLKTAESRALLTRMMELKPIRSTSLIDITIYSSDAGEASKIANAVAEVYATYLQGQRDKLLAGAVTAYKQMREDLQVESAQQTNAPATDDAAIAAMLVKVDQFYRATTDGMEMREAEIIERAATPYRPVRPNKPLCIFEGSVIGGLLGLMIGTISVLVLERMLRKTPAAA